MTKIIPFIPIYGIYMIVAGKNNEIHKSDFVYYTSALSQAIYIAAIIIIIAILLNN